MDNQDSIPLVKKFNGRSKFDQKNCPITFERLKFGDTIVEFACGHIAKKNNMNIWLRYNNYCPVCRNIIFNRNY